MTWADDREQRRAARERARIRREFADLDRRYGYHSAPGDLTEQFSPEPPRRRRGCFSRLISLVLIAAMGAMAFSVVGTGAAADQVRALVERAAGVVDSLVRDAVGDLDWAYEDPLAGQPGSGGDGYTFAMLQRDGETPATWGCEGTIPIEVNPDGAPSGYADLVSSAVDRINGASGFQFDVVGETSDRNFLQRGRGPVLLGFADESEVEGLSGRVAGLGGATYFSEGGGRLQADGGMVALDTDVFTDSLPARHAEAILMHELAHVLGLGHTDSRGELMSAANFGQTDFGPGDRAGLAHLREAACG